MKRILIIGSEKYEAKMLLHWQSENRKGHLVKMPLFDKDMPIKGDEGALLILKGNRERIIWAEEVHLFWDGRSIGTLFDLGMCFALRKPLKIIFLENKTFIGAIKEYSNQFKKCKSKGRSK